MYMYMHEPVSSCATKDSRKPYKQTQLLLRQLISHVHVVIDYLDELLTTV